jgi:hypothetical protein
MLRPLIWGFAPLPCFRAHIFHRQSGNDDEAVFRLALRRLDFDKDELNRVVFG